MLFSTTRMTSSCTLFPYTTLFRSRAPDDPEARRVVEELGGDGRARARDEPLVVGEARAELGGRRLRQLVHIDRSEEHTSELQSLTKLVCRPLLEKKKQAITPVVLM